MKLELEDEDVQRIARAVVDQLRAGEMDGWVDQTSSKLGPRRHCAMARRLIADATGDAQKIGRRWLIRRERLERETRAPVPAKETEAAETDREQRLARELGLRVVGGGRR